MNRTRSSQRILSLMICLVIIITGNVLAAKPESNTTNDVNEVAENEIDLHDHGEEEETPWWYCSCGGVVGTVCMHLNILADTYTHKYGSSQTCTIRHYTSRYMYYCDMSPWTGCPTTVDEYLHDCYYLHSSCGKGKDVFCVLAD